MNNKTNKKPTTSIIYKQYKDDAQELGEKFAQHLDRCLMAYLKDCQRDNVRTYYARQGATERYGRETVRISARIPREVWEWCEMNQVKKSVFINGALGQYSRPKGERGFVPCCCHCAHHVGHTCYVKEKDTGLNEWCGQYKEDTF